MEREQALKLIGDNLQSENLIYHSLAVEAVMKGLAKRFGQDEKLWALAGLLHDVDYEQTANNPKMHGLVSEQILSEYNLDDSLIHAIKAHNKETGVELITDFDKALYCADPITGLITACALVRPNKKLEEVEVKSVKKKFKNQSFAKGASRIQIDSCINLGLERNEFIEISLESMKKIAKDIGL